MKRILALTALTLLALTATPAYAKTDHCPDHNSPDVTKVEAQGDNLNSTVLVKGTEFCVKGGISTSGNKLTADGETTLRQYLGTGQDVSYYVVYTAEIGVTTTTTTSPPPTTTTTAPELPPVVKPEPKPEAPPVITPEPKVVERPAPPISPQSPAEHPPVLPRTGSAAGLLSAAAVGMVALGSIARRFGRRS